MARDVVQARQHCEYPDWRVGVGGITSNDIILIGLIHVSQGSWQPIPQLKAYPYALRCVESSCCAYPHALRSLLTRVLVLNQIRPIGFLQGESLWM